ncbi:MAG: M23 family metallopeptidase [Myxococcota bacterium]|nr:M23 family metallopeptidase [Myxococcota bacterium]
MKRFYVPCLIAIGAFAVACDTNRPDNDVPEKVVPLRTYSSTTAVGPHQDSYLTLSRGQIRPNMAVSSTLQKAGMNGGDIESIVRVLRPYFDWRLAKPGHQFEYLLDGKGALVWFSYSVDKTLKLHAYRDASGQLLGVEEKALVRTSTAYVQGEIKHSLYMAMDSASEKPQLTLNFVDLFAWDIDFFTETRKGDRFRLIVEKQFVGGEFYRYGKILAAEYQRAEGQTHQAFFYDDKEKIKGYYTADGGSVKKAFLKSPIQFASITSRFGMRRHPVLKYRRAHRGVDYGAPRGTAIWAIGDGVVRKAGRGGGYGNVVYLRHANGFETRYAHLKSFARGIRAGKRVSQKQVIGYVGSTGLATGPHLHFETLKHGRHVNPLRVVVPPAPPIPKERLAGYKQSIEALAQALASGRTK